MYIYEVCPEGIQPCKVKSRDIHWRRFKIQETLYIGQWCLNPLQSRHLGTSFSFPSISSTVQNTLQNPLLESPSDALLYCPESHRRCKISSISKMLLVLGKARSSRASNLGCWGAESPEWFDIFAKKLCTRLDGWVGASLWWRCQSPVAHSYVLLNHPNSFCRGMFKLNAKYGADLLLY